MIGVAPAANPNEWNQLGHDPQRTSYAPMEIPGPWRIRWIWNGPAGGDGGPAAGHLRLPEGVQPVLGGGRLYVGHDDGIVRAISTATGQQVWASPFLEAAIVNTAAYDADTNSVFVGTTSGRFWQLNASTGVVKVSNRPGGQILMAPLLVGDTVYVGSTSGVFYAFNKQTLAQRWSYNAGAALIGSAAYSASEGGQIILLAEDRSVHAIRASDGVRRWRVTVNADGDPLRDNTVFSETYPVVSDANGAVIVRSYLIWDKMWQPDHSGTSVAGIRDYLSRAENVDHQSFFVLNLSNGSPRYVAPVLLGSIGNGGDFESVPPQAVVKQLAGGGEVAYLLWRNEQACPNGSSCDPRDDTALGEMDLSTGNIRFIQDYKSQGNMRFPTDEQSPLSMAGNTLLHAHWASLGSIRITDRSPQFGDTRSNAIRAVEVMPLANTLTAGTCSARSNHFCPQGFADPGGVSFDPGLYVYYFNKNVYDELWTTPVRNAVVSDGTIYWRSVDGVIVAVETNGSAPPPTPMPTQTPMPTLTGLDEHNYIPSVVKDGP
jgi:outer membrane protein assembly factor BamB